MISFILYTILIVLFVISCWAGYTTGRNFGRSIKRIIQERKNSKDDWRDI